MLLRQPSADFIKISHSVTFKLALATVIACLSTLQFGFHLAVLNAPQGYMSCNNKITPEDTKMYQTTVWHRYNLPQCIPMSDNKIALITTMFTVGGLISSVVIGFTPLPVKFGRKSISIANSIMYLVGCGFMVAAKSVVMICVGRLLAGMAAGASLVISPILINELTPFNHRGFLGSLLQFAVATGILTSQVIAIPWSNYVQWRWIFAFSGAIAVAQFIMLFSTVESPKWLILNRGDVDQATGILHKVRSESRTVKHEIDHWRRLSVHTYADIPPTYGSAYDGTAGAKKTTTVVGVARRESSDDDIDADSVAEFAPLSHQVSRRGSVDPSHIGAREFICSAKYRLERQAIWLIMTGQQLCGMNAITFYGVSILSSILPASTNVLYITCSLALCNVITSLAISPFVDRIGRKPLLLASLVIMGLCSFVIAYGLTNAGDYLVAFACFGFIFGYSIGLGQLPFLMISELTSHESVGVAQSYGSAMNWTANIMVAYFFPILREKWGGYTFYIFFVICTAYLGMFLVRVPETKGKTSYREVWNKYESFV